LGQVGVFERLPVEGVKVGRAGDFRGQVLDAGLQGGFVAGVGLPVGKDLVEEGLTTGGDAGGGLLGADLVGKGETEVLFKVPLQAGFFVLGEGVDDGDSVLFAVVKDEEGVCVGGGLLADADVGYAPPSVTTRR